VAATGASLMDAIRGLLTQASHNKPLHPAPQA
jgi:hypothetical protein